MLYQDHVTHKSTSCLRWDVKQLTWWIHMDHYFLLLINDSEGLTRSLEVGKLHPCYIFVEYRAKYVQLICAERVNGWMSDFRNECVVLMSCAKKKSRQLRSNICFTVSLEMIAQLLAWSIINLQCLENCIFLMLYNLKKVGEYERK